MMRSRRSPPAMYSVTMKIPCFLIHNPINCTMFGWDKLLFSKERENEKIRWI